MEKIGLNIIKEPCTIYLESNKDNVLEMEIIDLDKKIQKAQKEGLISKQEYEHLIEGFEIIGN